MFSQVCTGKWLAHCTLIYSHKRTNRKPLVYCSPSHVHLVYIVQTERQTENAKAQFARYKSNTIKLYYFTAGYDNYVLIDNITEVGQSDAPLIHI